jgi:hypothetical protein
MSTTDFRRRATAVTENLRICTLLNKGNARIVSSEFLDWLADVDDSLPGKMKGLATRLRTLPNPDRVGVLDEFIAFTRLENLCFHVPGILKMNGKDIMATVSCGRDKPGRLGLWFVGFNNSCQWKGDLTESDVIDMIHAKTITLCKPATYANGEEVGA